MEARGDVVVVSEDGRRLTTPELRYGQTRNQIMSDSSFVLTDSTQKMTGVGFVSDPNMNNVRCLKACAGSAGMVTLPGSGDTTRVAPPVHRQAPTLPPSAGLPSSGGPSVVAPPGPSRAPAGGPASTAPVISPQGGAAAGGKPAVAAPAIPAPVAAPDTDPPKTPTPRLPPSGAGAS
jgi:hypothetical protein